MDYFPDVLRTSSCGLLVVKPLGFLKLKLLYSKAIG